jgi:hypothetical protein
MPKYVKGKIIFINAIALKIARRGNVKYTKKKLITSCYSYSIGTLPLCQQVLLVNKNTQEMVIGRVLKRKEMDVYTILVCNAS